MHTGWASPPLLFGLAPRGVFRAPDVATRAVGSYSTFSPLPNALDRTRPVSGFAKNLPQRCKHHRRSIFCGTFRSRAAAPRFRATCDATPWRYQARCPIAADSCELTTTGVRTFLPPALFRDQAGDHPAHPSNELYATRQSATKLAGDRTVAFAVVAPASRRLFSLRRARGRPRRRVWTAKPRLSGALPRGSLGKRAVAFLRCAEHGGAASPDSAEQRQDLHGALKESRVQL